MLHHRDKRHDKQQHGTVENDCGDRNDNKIGKKEVYGDTPETKHHKRCHACLCRNGDCRHLPQTPCKGITAPSDRHIIIYTTIKDKDKKDCHERHLKAQIEKIRRADGKHNEGCG